MSRSEALCIRRISSPEDIKDCLRFVLRVFRETAGREFDDEGRASFSAFIYSFIRIIYIKMFSSEFNNANYSIGFYKEI